MYCDNNTKIPNFLNNCLQESLGLDGNNSDYSFL